MKRLIARTVVAAAWFLLAAVWPLSGGPAGAADFESLAKAAILIDARTGQVLYEKDADVPRPPASMSKLMTAFMLFERIQSGRLALTDTLPVSEKAWRTGGSKMFVKVGDRVAVQDLMRGMIIQSGNDACVVIAEGIAGSEEAFAAQMTRRGIEIGLTHSHFANADGLPSPEHYMSMRDLATLARAIIAQFPEYYPIYSEEEYEYQGIKQYSRNPLLRSGVAGVDGMKTGFTDDAGYGIVVSAIRDGRRLIAVLGGLDSAKLRAQESERLIEHGFRDFEEYKLFAGGQKVADADVWLGAAPTVPLLVKDQVALTMTPEARRNLVVKLIYQAPVQAPVAAGTSVGRVEISGPDMAPATSELVTGDAVAPIGLMGRMSAAIGYLMHRPS